MAERGVAGSMAELALRSSKEFLIGAKEQFDGFLVGSTLGQCRVPVLSKRGG